MSRKKDDKNNEDWFQKLDFPLKQVHSNYVKLNIKRKEIVNHQKLLNEFNINKSKNKKIKLTKKDAQVNNQFDEKKLLNRFNIYNYKELDRENLILKNLLSKMEQSVINKSKKKLKKYKTNHEYDVSEISCNNRKHELKLDKENNDENNKFNLGHINNTEKKDDSIKKPIKLNKIHLKRLKYINSSENTPQSTDRSRNNKPIELSTENNLNNDHTNNTNNTNSENYLSTDEPNKNNNIDIFENKNLISEISNVEKNDTSNNNNFFQTLTRVNQDGEKKRMKKNKLSKLQNLFQMMKVVHDGDQNCQKSGKIINTDLIKIKNKKVMLSINKTEQRKNNLSINYSRIKTRKDIEEKILNNPQLHIYEHLKNNIKINSQKRIMSENYNGIYRNHDEENININNNKRKNSLILPKIHT